MNKIKFFLAVLATILILILGALGFVAGVIFLAPEKVINEKVVRYVLDKTKIFKSYSLEKLDFRHERLAWNHRNLSGEIKGFCFNYANVSTSVDTCLNNLEWNFDLSWSLLSGFEGMGMAPIKAHLGYLNVGLIPEEKTNEEVVDYYSYWRMLWHKSIPDIVVQIDKISIQPDLRKDSKLDLDLYLSKLNRELIVDVLDFNLIAHENDFKIYIDRNYKIPFSHELLKPLVLDSFVLNGRLSERKLDLTLNSRMQSVSLDVTAQLLFKELTSELTKPSYLEQILNRTKASIRIIDLKKTLKQIVKAPYNEFPAPINAMEGNLLMNFDVSNYGINHFVTINNVTTLKMDGTKQEVDLELKTQMPLSLENYSLGELIVNLDINKLRLLLPDISLTQLPTNLLADKRIIKTRAATDEEKKSNKTEYNVVVKTPEQSFIVLNSNLVDEPVKFKTFVNLSAEGIKELQVGINPLRTTFFKRKIHLVNFLLSSKEEEQMQLKSKIEFNLPEYRVTLDLEGPASAPRMAFSSYPPLAQDDIYAVLLFGRPLSDLNPDDSQVAQDTNKLMAQGVLSLAVLYYLSGTPIEAIGYNDESKVVTAQIGLGSKSSLRIGGNSDGVSSAGVRRSLGKGWYLDSSVQKSSSDLSTSNNFGVMLERIIAY